jgi:O-antigen/teichoic acid export membrane protein
MSLTKKLIKNSSLMTFSELSVQILSYFIIIVLAQQTGSYGLGQYSFVISFVTFMFIFSDIGMSYLLVRDVSRDKRLAQKYFSNMLPIKSLLLVIAIIVTLVVTYIFGRDQTVVISILLFSLILFIDGFISLSKSIMQSFENFEVYVKFTLLERIITFSIGIFILYQTGSLIGFFAAMLFAYIISFTYILNATRKYVKLTWEINIALWKKIVRRSMPFWLTGLFMFIYFRTDTVMLGLLTSYNAVGYYNAAYKFIDLFVFLPGLLVVVLLPTMSSMFKKDAKRLRNMINVVFRYVLMLGIPLAAGTYLIAERLILFVYGESFLPHSALALQILAIAVLFIFINTLLGNLLNAIGQQKKFLFAAVITATLNVILNFILILQYEYIGAAIATVATQALCFTILLYFVGKHFMKIKLIKLWKILLSVGIMSLAVMQLLSYSVLIIVPIAIVVYFGSILLLGLEEDDMQIIKQLFN